MSAPPADHVTLPAALLAIPCTQLEIWNENRGPWCSLPLVLRSSHTAALSFVVWIPLYAWLPGEQTYLR